MQMVGLRHIYEMIVEGIQEYTSLSPTAFLVIVGIMIITYKIVCGMFVAADDYKAVREMNEVYEEDMRREPVQIGGVTEEELKAYDGSDPKKPLLMAIKGQIYDVSRGRMFYGPGGPYAMFAGHDATRALALMSFDPQDLTGDTDGLSESELDVLEDWELKFNEKYPKDQAWRTPIGAGEQSDGLYYLQSVNGARACNAKGIAKHELWHRRGIHQLK